MNFKINSYHKFLKRLYKSIFLAIRSRFASIRIDSFTGGRKNLEQTHSVTPFFLENCTFNVIKRALYPLSPNQTSPYRPRSNHVWRLLSDQKKSRADSIFTFFLAVAFINLFLRLRRVIRRFDRHCYARSNVKVTETHEHCDHVT